MSRYVVGDVQGCWRALARLLTVIEFEPETDELWLVGDLVNRGPASLDVLRYARDLGDRATVVLGNHDLHLLARAAGVARPKRRDTLEAVLAAADRDGLLAWLVTRPLMVEADGIAMVHAGLVPAWTIDQALSLAAETSAMLTGPNGPALLAAYGDDDDDTWSERLDPTARARVVLNAMTRLRVCRADGSMNLGFKGRPGESSNHDAAWFAMAGRRSRGTRILFGHWSALGSKVDPEFVALDTGCVWGGGLSAIRLEDDALFRVECDGS
jgi:bis(5'-nucleosyl)-tetraphosphatase (symmetrical)